MYIWFIWIHVRNPFACDILITHLIYQHKQVPTPARSHPFFYDLLEIQYAVPSLSLSQSYKPKSPNGYFDTTIWKNRCTVWEDALDWTGNQTAASIYKEAWAISRASSTDDAFWSLAMSTEGWLRASFGSSWNSWNNSRNRWRSCFHWMMRLFGKDSNRG